MKMNKETEQPQVYLFLFFFTVLWKISNKYSHIFVCAFKTKLNTTVD